MPALTALADPAIFVVLDGLPQPMRVVVPLLPVPCCVVVAAGASNAGSRPPRAPALNATVDELFRALT